MRTETSRPRMNAFMPAPGGALVSSPRASKTVMSMTPDMNSLKKAVLKVNKHKLSVDGRSSLPGCREWLPYGEQS